MNLEDIDYLSKLHFVQIKF